MGLKRQSSVRKLFEGVGSMFLHLDAETCDHEHCVFIEATFVLKTSSIHIMNDMYVEGQMPSITFALHSTLQLSQTQMQLGIDIVQGVRWNNFPETTGLQGRYFTFLFIDPGEASQCCQALDSLGLLQPEAPKGPPSSQLIARPIRAHTQQSPPEPAQPTRGSTFLYPEESCVAPQRANPKRVTRKSVAEASQEPLDEVRHLYTLDQLLYVSYCQLYMHNRLTDSNDFVQAGLVLALVKQKPLIYTLDVISGGEVQFSTLITDEFAFNSDEANHSITWLHTVNDAFFCYIAVVSSPLARLVSLLPRLCFEVFRGEAIEDTEEYWFSSYSTQRDESAQALPILNWGDAFEIEMEGSINHLTTHSLMSNLSLVASDSLMSLYRTDIDHLDCLNQIRVADGRKLSVPSCLTLQPGDRLGFQASSDKLFQVDLERGSVVRKWTGRTWTGLAPDSLESCVIGVTKSGMYLIDARAKADASKKEYSGNPNFTCVGGYSADGVVAGTEKGEIRLYKEIGQNSKTNFPHVGAKIKSIDISHDKCWVLATTKHFLLVIPTTYKQLSGFRDRLGKNKQPPLRLSLTPTDVSRFCLTSIDFSPAKFEKCESEQEHSITTSTNSFLIVWNFDSVKRGLLNDYSLRNMGSQVISAATQPTQPHIVVTMDRFLKVQSRSR